MFAKARNFWRRGWMLFASPHGFGKLASRMAALGTAPYHGRVFLAYIRTEGFVAHTAAVSHLDLRRGNNVYLGDRVTISSGPGSGPVELGDEVQVYGDTFIHTAQGGSLAIGHGTHVQPGCYLYACVSEIVIGRKVEIAAGCAFYSYNHGVEPGTLIMDQPLCSKGKISVGDGAWIGHGVTVLDGVRIGHGAVIGAGAVVNRDVPDNAIAAGVPARVIRERRA